MKSRLKFWLGAFLACLPFAILLIAVLGWITAFAVMLALVGFSSCIFVGINLMAENSED